MKRSLFGRRSMVEQQGHNDVVWDMGVVWSMIKYGIV